MKRHAFTEAVTRSKWFYSVWRDLHMPYLFGVSTSSLIHDFAPLFEQIFCFPLRPFLAIDSLRHPIICECVPSHYQIKPSHASLSGTVARSPSAWVCAMRDQTNMFPFSAILINSLCLVRASEHLAACVLPWQALWGKCLLRMLYRHTFHCSVLSLSDSSFRRVVPLFSVSLLNGFRI